jgi:hypothetical protein
MGHIRVFFGYLVFFVGCNPKNYLIVVSMPISKILDKLSFANTIQSMKHKGAKASGSLGHAKLFWVKMLFDLG